MAYPGGMTQNLSRQGSQQSLGGYHGNQYASHTRLQPHSNAPVPQQQLSRQPSQQSVHQMSRHGSQRSVNQQGYPAQQSDHRGQGHMPYYQGQTEMSQYDPGYRQEPQYRSQHDLQEVRGQPHYGSQHSVSKGNVHHYQGDISHYEGHQGIPYHQSQGHMSHHSGQGPGQLARHDSQHSLRHSSHVSDHPMRFDRQDSEAPPPYVRESDHRPSHPEGGYSSQHNLSQLSPPSHHNGLTQEEFRKSQLSLVNTSPYVLRRESASRQATPLMSRREIADPISRSQSMPSHAMSQSVPNQLSRASSISGSSHPIPEGKKV